MTAEELRTALDVITAEQPEIGKATVYYIGNIWHAPYCDDRSWAVCLNDWRVDSDQHHYAPHNLNIGTTEELESLTLPSLYYLLGKQVGIAAKAYRQRYGKRSPFVDDPPFTPRAERTTP